MFKNTIIFKQKKLFQTVQIALFSSILSMGTVAHAAAPDNVQIKDLGQYFDEAIKNQYGNGAFDLNRESSTMVSAATQSLEGTAPGLRTIATVNNDLGEVRVCSTITVNYQIIDIDGDWDAAETLPVSVPDETGSMTTYEHFKTSDTIRWGFRLNETKPTNPDEIIWISGTEIESEIVANKIKLKVPETITVNEVEVSTIGMSLVYSIVPWTMIGSEPAKANVFEVLVDDLEDGKYIQPGALETDVAQTVVQAKFLESISLGAFTYPGLPNPEPEPNISFVKVATIGEADPADCALPKNEVQVVIYDASNKDSNLIEKAPIDGKSVIENLQQNPKLYTVREYRAEVLIKNNEDGTTRKLTQAEYEDKGEPFTWNVKYPADESCLAAAWNTGLTCLNENNKSFNAESADDVKASFGAEFSATGELNYAWFKTQENNSNAKVKSVLEGSEQGSFLSVSFGYEE